MNWKDHFEEMISKLIEACYVVRLMVHISNINTLIPIYNAYCHSIIIYRIIIWGNSSNSEKIFTLQKKIVIIMAGAHPRTSCGGLYKQLEILLLPCQYTVLLMRFVTNNQTTFQTN
jgi:hypothetical protein